MIFDKTFRKKSKLDVPAMPTWETIVEMMYDQHLDGYSAEVIQAIYSKDQSKRYVILKDERGFFTYQLEAIYQYDPSEWQYIGSNKNALPAMWESVHGMAGKSLFENINELLIGLRAEPEYQQYFYHERSSHMKTVLERFLHYVSFNTRSDEESSSCPSTPGQLTLGAALVEEMKAMGIKDAAMDKNGYIMGTVPGDPSLPTVGLIAHMDTSPDCSGENIRAKVMHYIGNDLCLNEQKDIWLRAADYPSLLGNVGKHLVVTDGTTLLGADDKAGIAEIMTAVERLIAQGGKHATVKIGFTPDEEIGRGADLFDVKAFGADYAYTVDGGTLGELEYENFNAAGAQILITGRNIHPGSAKNKLVNSQLIAMELNALLPVHQRPESTEGYEGFYHLIGINGGVEETTLRYIIRDHDMEKFNQKKDFLTKAVAFINEKYGMDTAKLELKDSYYNMREKIEPCMYVVDRALKAMEAVGMTPKTVPIRGGTDGARLSFEGLPCPNLCTGGENYHGRFEYIPVEDMELCVEMLVKLIRME